MEECSATKIREHLIEITECCICTETYTDPKILPCVHTFCRECLQRLGSDSAAGDSMPCPICRQEFTIPENGFAALQKNFFIETLIQHAKTFSQRATSCDVCSGDLGSSKDVPAAEEYCKDCRQHMCSECSRHHHRNRASRTHATITVEPVAQRKKGQQVDSNICEKHDNQELSIFCLMCREVLCAMCFLGGHQHHKWSEIGEIEIHFRRNMEENIRRTSTYLSDAAKKKEELGRERSECIERMLALEAAISKQRDDLIQLVDSQTNSLLTDLESLRQKRLKEIDTERDKIDQHHAILESYRRSCAERSNRGSAADICRAADAINARAAELAELHGSVFQRQLRLFDVSFVGATLQHGTNIVGSVEATLGYKSNPILVHTIEPQGHEPDSLRGMTLLGSELFLVHARRASVEVYDSDTFFRKRKLDLKWPSSVWSLLWTQKLKNPWDIASCGTNKCLYIVDARDDEQTKQILRIDPKGNVIKYWSTGSCSGLLSVTPESNVILLLTKLNKLNEYAPDGKLLREVALSSKVDVVNPTYAIKTASGQILLSYGDSDDIRQGVCTVDSKGSVLESFEFTKDSSEIQMVNPSHLAVDDDGSILVADAGNSRVLLLNSQLEFQRELVSDEDGLGYPRRMCLDSQNCRLFVLDSKEDDTVAIAQVLIFNIK